MQIPNLETWSKFDRLYFHAKSKVKSEKYHKVKFHTSFKSCGHAESKFYIIKQESFFGQTIYFKIEGFLKIFNFKVNSQALKSAPNAYKLLSNILAIEVNYI